MRSAVSRHSLLGATFALVRALGIALDLSLRVEKKETPTGFTQYSDREKQRVRLQFLQVPHEMIASTDD